MSKGKTDFKLIEIEQHSDYLGAQQQGYRVKPKSVWALEPNIAFLSDYINHSYSGRIRFGICHGVRTGIEARWFAQHIPGCNMIGTDVGEGCEKDIGVINHDFHVLREDWIGCADFIYSNSLDHAWNPELALEVWAQSLTQSGVIILEHTSNHGPKYVGRRDPFGATLPKMVELILEWGPRAKTRYRLREILKAPVKRTVVSRCSFIVIELQPRETE